MNQLARSMHLVDGNLTRMVLSAMQQRISCYCSVNAAEMMPIRHN